MSDIIDSKLALALSRLLDEDSKALVVVSSIISAKRFAADLSFYSDAKVYILPEGEEEFFDYEARNKDDEEMILAALSAIEKNDKVVVIAPKSITNEKLPNPNEYKDKILKLDLSTKIDRDKLVEKLVFLGYERKLSCEAYGEYSVRGDIIDVYGPSWSLPIRIELFDDDIDSIRSFEPYSQRSVESLSSVEITRCKLDHDGEYKSTIYDYFTDKSLVFTREEDFEYFSIKPAPVFAGHMDLLAKELRKYLENGYSITIAAQNGRKENLIDFLEREKITKVRVLDGKLTQGAELPYEKLLYLSDNDIFTFAKHAKKSSKASKLPIKAFTDIKPGDYIVHEMHGIGQFIGVVKLTADGSTKDYLKIAYAGKDVLYVPVDQMSNIQKYMGSESAAPRISKLSGTDWASTKHRVKESIREMAEEFIKNAAKRASATGFAFAPDSEWQKEFEEAFPYVETDDQLRCIAEIKKDMESSKVMDRLLCGDVGYGKTEVAARAIFKALEQGKQVAVLVPTTVLANQHYHSFLERFKNYPFSIQMLSRFRSDKECDVIVDGLAKGEIDLVVGTHRILSKDVVFKDLGLLVVDEEQRFGVEHKEAIKRLKENVDVLTLSATPIPRTLHMSLLGVREMSVIEQPPQDRYPVSTYVMEQDDNVIASAIKRELARDGQVYIVYNRVKGIQTVAKHIKELVPDASLAIGHGQMNEGQLEDVMMDFAEGKTQILLATTIIESGLDIPNVNTLIVLDADHFGLSQLYQLRGRVGRSNRMAYAFLFYKKDKQLSEIAEKRLKAIKEFTEFGSGFRVAMRDLELRGAGNLLGIEQSGHMLQIGYELYCKLVEEAIAELTGVAASEKKLEADTQVEIGLSAFLPEKYVPDELTRLDMYKKISIISSDEDKNDIYDELIDRFGEIPNEALNLMNIAYIRNLASPKGIFKIARQNGRLIFCFEKENHLSPEMIASLYDNYGPALTVYAGEEPRISVVIKKHDITDDCFNFLKKLG